MTTTSTPAAARPDTGGAGAPEASRRRPGLLLAAVLGAMFMALLDVFIVNVAAPTVQSDLDASGGSLQLVIAGYTIAYAVLLVTGARLGGRHGLGRLFLAGLALFTLASLACGLAPTAGLLIAFRFVQGAGAALMLPQVLSLIQRTFTGAERARALAMFSAVLASGAAAGQVVGGALVSADLFGWGWRPVFLVNVPIGLALLALGARVIPLDRPAAAERTRSLDLPGLTLLTAAVLAFTVPLVLGQEEDWPLWCWLLLAASVVLLGLFTAYESRLSRRGGAPLLSPRVLRSPRMAMSASRILVVMALNAGVMFAASLHLQSPERAGGLGYGAMHAGLVFLPTAIAFGAVSMLWGRMPARWRPALAPGGLLLAAAALFATGLLLRDGDGIGPAALLIFFVNGCGMALAYAPTLTGALALVRPEDAPDASGVTGTMTQLGMLIGTATFGTLFLNRTEAELSTAEALWPTMIALSTVALATAAAGLMAESRARRPAPGTVA
ncbi:MFS transporter [Streptomyces sp. 6N223]|uniref:MFS transporter n=1 Tax=Streptomyces sp. 6N223 TaxID=3457412 RepID=UPI003FD04881